MKSWQINSVIVLGLAMVVVMAVVAWRMPGWRMPGCGVRGAVEGEGGGVEGAVGGGGWEYEVVEVRRGKASAVTVKFQLYASWGWEFERVLWGGRDSIFVLFKRVKGGGGEG